MPHPIIQAEVDEFRKRERRKENLKTGCAICGSAEDHDVIYKRFGGKTTTYTHQYDNGEDIKVFSDESFLSAAIHRAIEKERQAWLQGERCEGCGTENFNKMSSMCAKCSEGLPAFDTAPSPSQN